MLVPTGTGWDYNILILSPFGSYEISISHSIGWGFDLFIRTVCSCFAYIIGVKGAKELVKISAISRRMCSILHRGIECTLFSVELSCITSRTFYHSVDPPKEAP